MYEETKFQRFLIEYHDTVLKRLKLINTEEMLYSYADIITDELNSRTIFEENKIKNKKKQIGRIDVLFTYKSINYCGEIKYYPYKSGEFWDALKVLGYTEYYNFCNKPNKLFRPSILMPKDKIRLQELIIADKLKITLFGISANKRGYTMEIIDDSFKARFI